MSFVWFKDRHFLLKLVQLNKYVLDLFYDFFLLIFWVLDVSKSFLLEIALQEEGLYIFKLHE